MYNVSKDDVNAKDLSTPQSEAAAQHAESTAEPLQKQGAGDKPKLGGKAIKNIALYGLWRIVLFLVLTFLIHSAVILLGMADFFPLLISAMLALLLALPLSMVMFKGLRIRATESIAEWDAGRRAHKLQMRKQLEDRLG